MHGVKRGVLITFECVECSGKSTQAEAFVGWLAEKKLPHIFVRDPGGTAIGEDIRNVLLNPRFKNMHAKCEVLLFLAARTQLTYEKLRPAIENRQIVICDRFADSTFAYQTYARQMPARLIAVFNRFATAGIKPDLTFLVDLDVTTAQKRGMGSDRMEAEDTQYHEMVREGYLKLARRAKKRIKVLDGAQPVEALHEQVVATAGDLLLRKGYRL
jgi:dTMP kinase